MCASDGVAPTAPHSGKVRGGVCGGYGGVHTHTISISRRQPTDSSSPLANELRLERDQIATDMRRSQVN